MAKPLLLQAIPSVLAVTLIALAVAPTSAGTFNPTQISDLSLWLDAAQGVTESSGAVSAWADQSGNNHDFAQTDTGRMPAMATDPVSGRTVLSFQKSGASGDYLLLPTSSPNHLQLDTTFTAFFVVSPDELPADDSQRFFGHYPHGQIRFNQGKANTYSGGNGTLNTPTASVDEFQILVYQFDTSVKIGLNDVPATQVLASATVSSSNLNIGGYQTDYGRFNGDIGEIVIYDTPLNDTQSNNVGRYLSNKYGLKTDFGPIASSQAGLIVAEDFNYNRPGSPANPTAADKYIGGENGSQGAWTSGWTATGDARINGLDQTPENVVYTDSGEVTRSLSSSVADGTTLYFSISMRDSSATGSRARLFLRNYGTEEVGFGIHDGALRAQVGSYSPSMIFAPGTVNDQQWHLIVGKLEFNADGGSNEKLTLWLDPTGIEPATITGSYAANIGVLGIEDQIYLRQWTDNEVLWDDFRLGTTWASVGPVPEPGTLVLLALGLLGLALGRTRRRG